MDPESEVKDEAFAMESLGVRLGDDLEEEIEAFCDRMMEWGQELAEAVEEGDCHTAGLVLNLKDGRTVYAQVDPELLGRVMEVLTPEELGEMVNAIVDAVEQPQAPESLRNRGWPAHDSGLRLVASHFRTEDFHLQFSTSLSWRTECPILSSVLSVCFA